MEYNGSDGTAHSRGTSFPLQLEAEYEGVASFMSEPESAAVQPASAGHVSRVAAAIVPCAGISAPCFRIPLKEKLRSDQVSSVRDGIAEKVKKVGDGHHLQDTRRCHIIQLGAVCGNQTFNAYIVPQLPITQGAYEVNGFYVVDGILYRRKKAKPTVSLNRALTNFFRFLRSLDRPVCLAAHNANSFHVRILTRLLWRFHHFWKFGRVVRFYLDTLKVSKKINPGGSHKLKNLVGKDYDAHNGLEDAKVLQDLWKRWAVNDHDIQNFLFEW